MGRDLAWRASGARGGRTRRPRCLLAWIALGLALASCDAAGPPATPTRVAPAAPAVTAPTVYVPPPTPTTTPEPAVALPGTWIGGYMLPGGGPRDQRVSVHFAETSGQPEGQIAFPLDGGSAPVQNIERESDRVRFEVAVPTGGEPARFAGQVRGHTLAGTVQRGTAMGAFSLVQIDASAPSDTAAFAGTYRFASGEAIGFYPTAASSQVFATSLVYADLQTGALGAAFPISGTRFLIGPAVALAYPARGEVTFVRDATGAANGLIWTAAGAPPLQAQRVPVDTTEVTYPGGDGPSRLAGRLVTPRSPGRHPAVVLVHGAGKVTRRNWQTDLLSGLFALHGLATLSYDKRGVGDSEGVYVGGIASAQNISLLGRDALAGVAYLQSRADIDAAQIGLQGSSQAGWIIPYAAAESPDVAFMLLWSGPGVSQGISDLYDNLAETTAPAQLAETLRETPASGFDPLPYLARIRVPGFWAYGDRDLTVPVPESIAKLAALRAAGHPDFTWQVFPTGDHYLWTVASPTGDDLRLSPGFAPGLFPAMHTWLEAHIDAK